MWVDSINIGVGRVELWQHSHQAAVFQVARNVPFGAHQDAMAVQRPAHCNFPVVGAQAATGFDGLCGALLRRTAAAGGQPPQAIGFVALAYAYAVVARQVGRCLGRAGARQVGRRCAQQAPVARQQPRHHAGVGRQAETHADIEGVVGQRRRVDRQLQLHFHLRVFAHKTADDRRHMAAAETQRGVDTQQALRLALAGAQQMFQRLDIRQDAARMFRQQFALWREPHAACGAVHQRQLQPRFHQGQALADGRGADAHFTRRGTEAAAAGQCCKKPQVGGLDGACGGQQHC